VSATAIAGTPDASIKGKLDAKGTPFVVDDDGDYRINVNFKDEGRTQRVFVRSSVSTFRKTKVREVWSYGYEGDKTQLSALVANRLLEASHQQILGSWVKQGRSAMFVVKIPADASAEELDEAIDYAAGVADEMEKELNDGGDEF
ncbi:MAG: hypothetical protein ACREO3_05740, partial [Arenimonas sp.]